MNKRMGNKRMMHPGQNKDEEPSRQGKPKNNMMGMNKGSKKHKHMGMGGHSKGRTGRDEQKNTAEYVRNLGSSVVTSLVGQTTTTLTVDSSNGHHGEDSTNYSSLVAFISYGTTGSVSCADSIGHTYTHAAHVVFNTNYSVDLFYVTGVGSIPKNTIITVTHPNATRRVLIGDEFKGLDVTSAGDQVAQASASVAATFATSGMTSVLSQDKELLYGVIGVNGPITDKFKKAKQWTEVNDNGTAAGDGNDIRLITLFRTVNKADTYEVSGTLGTARLWGAITQSFKSNGGSSDITKDV
jgi:hypothetical protein